MATDRTSGALNAITSLAPLLLGTGTTTTKTSGTKSASASPDALAALRSLLGSDAANPNAAASLTQGAQANAIKLMLQAGIPSIGSAERGSGIYNSSQTAQATSQLEGQTAAAAAKLQLDQTNTAANLQGNTADALAKATGSVSTSDTVAAKTAPVVNPLLSMLGLGAGVLASNLFGGSGNKRSNNSGSSDTGGTGVAGSIIDGGGNISDSIANAFNSSSYGNFTPATSGSNASPLDSALSSFSSGDFAKTLLSGLQGDSNSNSGSGTGGSGGGSLGELGTALEGAAASTGLNALLSGIGSFFTGSSSGGDSNSGGGCFITTAVCKELQLADDCYELVTLRDFRDSYMLANAEGKELVEEYYATAPSIVAALGSSRDPNVRTAIYRDFNINFIKPAILAIEAKDYPAAQRIYTALYNKALSLASLITAQTLGD